MCAIEHPFVWISLRVGRRLVVMYKLFTVANQAKGKQRVLGTEGLGVCGIEYPTRLDFQIGPNETNVFWWNGIATRAKK